MKKEQINERQISAAVFTALLSPMVRVLPRLAAILAGQWAWLCVLSALPVLAALELVLRELRRGMGPGEGAAALFPRVYGKVLGPVLLFVCTAWFLFYAGFVLRSGAERLTSAVYPHSGSEIFVLLTLGAALAAVLGPLRAAVRAAAVLRMALIAVLGAVILLSVRNIETENLFPLRLEDARRLLPGMIPAATVGGTAALFVFLRGYASPTEDASARPFFWHLLLFVASATLLCLTTVGAFGEKLTARLAYPFFTMARDLSVHGTPKRFDAAVIALWVSADYVMCVFLLRCAHETLRTALRLPQPERAGNKPLHMRDGRWLLWTEAAAAGLCALVLPSGADDLRRWGEQFIPLIMNIFVFGGYPMLWLVGKLRKIL